MFKRIFTLLQNLDYRPGQAVIFKTVNISNIEFDMLLIMLAFGLILTVVFYLRFGLAVFGL
jgi:hypothetical protein